MPDTRKGGGLPPSPVHHRKSKHDRREDGKECFMSTSACNQSQAKEELWGHNVHIIFEVGITTCWGWTFRASKYNVQQHYCTRHYWRLEQDYVACLYTFVAEKAVCTLFCTLLWLKNKTKKIIKSPRHSSTKFYIYLQNCRRPHRREDSAYQNDTLFKVL